MPTPKQMEKLAAEAARRPRPPAAPRCAPSGRILGVGAQGSSRHANGAQMRQRRLSDIQRHVLRVSCRRCERTVEIQTVDAVRLYGGNAIWKDVAQRLLDAASNAPAGTKKMGAGRRFERP